MPHSWNLNQTPKRKSEIEFQIATHVSDRYRRLWYNLMHELKHFQSNLLGELKRADSPVRQEERYRPVPHPLPKKEIRSFTWEVEQVTWRYKTPTEFDIIEVYDRWYWMTLLAVVCLIKNSTKLKDALELTKRFSCVHHDYDMEDEWRSHHYFMHKAILRNKNSISLPPWTWRCLNLC